MGIRKFGPAAAGVLLTAATAAVVLTSSTPASAATATFTPVADTYVQSDTASANYGTSAQIVVDNSPVRRTFLRFTVSGVSGAVTGAKLRLRTISGNSGSANGGTFRAVSDTTWSETGTTWANQPAIDGATLGAIGSVSANGWYEVDVTAAVTGNGTFSFGATSADSDGAYYDTRETGADAPQLVLTTGTDTPSGDPVLVGAGDIANSGSGDTATATLLDGIAGTVFTTGDNVYENGTASEFSSYYAPTWGRHKARTKPSPGNHDYNTSGATGYFTYFGVPSYYSYDLGNWHVVALNSNIAMTAGSAQERWLRTDLAASAKPCTLAYWHHPLYTSSANHAPSTGTRPLYQALYD
jgi:calcineurin-like phosphoesterase family protein